MGAAGFPCSYSYVSTRTGAGRVVLGAASTREATVSVFVPSQSLALMQPVLKKLRKGSLPCVLHVTAVSIGDGLTYSTDFSGVFLARDTGAAIVASYSPQECYQIALVSHIVAQRCSMPVAHVFDADMVARGAGAVTKLGATDDLRSAQRWPGKMTDAAETFQTVFDEMAPSFNRGFRLFESPVNVPAAVHVVVLFGGAVGPICAAAAAAEADIHVVQVRVYRPWSPEAFIASLPDAVRRLPASGSWSICVATVSSRSGVQNALVADVTTTLSSHWRGASPRVIKCTVLPDSDGLTLSKARTIVDRLLEPPRDLNQSMVLGNSFSSSSGGGAGIDAAQPSLAVWGTSGDGDAQVQQLVAAVGEKVMGVGGTQVATSVDADVYHPSQPVLGRLVLHSGTGAPLYFPETFASVLVLSAGLLATHAGDIAACISRGATIYVVSDLDGDELLDAFPGVLRECVAAAGATVAAVGSAGGASSEVDVAVAALLGHPMHDVVRFKTPGFWCLPSPTPSEDGSTLSEKTFTRRLSVSTPIKQADAAGSPTKERKEIVDSHAVAWNVMFKSANVAATEILRPEEHAVFRVKCTKNVRLTPEDYPRNVFHMEFDTTGTGLTYNIGDALGVFGHNDPAEVASFLAFYELSSDSFVSLPHADSKELLSIEQLLTTRLDLFGKPSQKFYAAMAHYASDGYEQKRLKWLGSEDKEGFKLRQLETTTYADVLRDFPSARPPLLDLIELVPPIKPRHYSIASSIKMNPDSVHLLVVAVDWKTPSGKTRTGQCTRYLASLDPSKGDVFVTVDIKPSVCQLPADPKTPIICAGLGTGLAPYRAYIQERTFLKSQGVALGPMCLYFGARYRASEYLYGDELDEAARNGVITNLQLAFSRDQKEKVYIQDKITEDKDLLAKYFQKENGYFYMCGPTWPVPDVKAAICAGLTAGSGWTDEDADQYLEELKEEGRYVLEVY